MDFHKILSTFVELPEKPVSTQTPTSTPEPAASTSLNFALSQSVPYNSPVSSGVSDPTLAENFGKKIQAAYSSSPNYNQIVQFNENLSSLKDDIPEEGSRFRAALKVLHVTPQQMVDAYQSLIGVIVNEDKRFSQAIEQQRENEIGSREQKVKEINSQIEAAQNQIKDLMSQRDTIATESVSFKTKYDTAETTFDGAAKSLEMGIQDILRKFNIYTQTASTSTKA